MFFIISKVLAFLVNPTIWLFVGLFFWLKTKKPILKKRLSRLLIISAFLLSNSFIYLETLRLYTPPPISPSDLSGSYEYGVILTGMTNRQEAKQTVHISSAGDRIWQAIDLYNRGKIEKILITGGNSKIVPGKYREAEYLTNFLLESGFPQKNIICEPTARNTYENAQFTADLLENYSDKVLVITSALHMPRSVACFKNTPLAFDIYPTNPITERIDYSWQTFILPSPGTLAAWNGLIHEWLGFFFYKLAGYI